MLWLPVSLGLSLLAVVLHTLFQPRLPQYSFRVNSMVPKWAYRRVQVGAGVKLQNDNFVSIDIHSLSFDMFYPDWNGKIQHIGQVHDVKQSSSKIVTTTATTTTTMAPVDDTEQSTSTSPPPLVVQEEESTPLWALQARQAFETIDNVLLQPEVMSLSLLGNLSWDLFQLGGVITLPSSGVIHVKANRQVPLTLSILCDNLLNTWTMELEGRSCSLEAMDFGWMDMDNSVQRLRQKVMEQNDKEEELVDDFTITLHQVSDVDVDDESSKTLSFQEEFDRLQRKMSVDAWKTSALSYFGHYPSREKTATKMVGVSS